MANSIGLNEVKIKSRVKVVQILPESKVRKKIMDMGIVRGTEIVVAGKAPMGDPIELQVRGYSLSLRKNEAKDILVELV
ncbi:MULTISPECIES: FeoA family protein [Clostridium]|uniref:Ferrous iron transport protein A n=2 Tax=Clostridium TaxID=1485 RepID=D8GSP4_CLOLD|nr:MULTISPECIES: ferrous iron transport protein A [Clostridium]ADK14464.1 ferrous iron transport protein A [Clostridium ljungdahlii DSM 13528]AGY77682.1 ferrous iron transport protein A [Clostridium autoethanogenum DSM 10061]ALU37821.1 FeoA family protein [Clostridium autoethanogenum DSM 10061]OAA88115.1 ferrous iron transport protein A [Clostridium ljungdahlii DSM 13528]OVY49828.1 ferrous iron transport protein A [Clostridium autoethanogenum]